MTNARVFLDAGGRAPVHPAGQEAFAAAVDQGWADPRRLYSEARQARALLDAAREVLGGALGVRAGEIRLTPSHTASLHAAVLAVGQARHRAGRRVVASAVERAALLAAARHLDPDLTTIAVDDEGRVDLDQWFAALGPDVAVAALQHANGEVGTLQPVAAAWEAAHSARVPLLVDAGASVGHVALGTSWDVLAADPGDWGGPAGIGVLAVRSHVRTAAVGPEDEDQWAPGGVSVPAAVGAAAALRAVLAEQADQDRRRRRLIDRIRTTVAQTVPDVQVVGDPQRRLPHVVTFSCLYVGGEALVTELDRRGFAIGSGSACTSATLQPSHVLAAMGALTHGNVRLALPTTVTEDDVERFLAELPDAVATVRQLLGAVGL